MRTISLNGTWEAYLDKRISVSVPGCYDKYITAKDYAKPVRMERGFTVKTDASCRYSLVCKAVSYYCEIEINGVFAFSHEGIWDEFRLDVTELLRDGENLIAVTVTKPGYYETDAFPLRQVLSGFIPDVLCTFGGIWGDIFIEESRVAFFDYHYAGGGADGRFSLVIGVQRLPCCASADICVTIKAPDGAEVFAANMQKALPEGELTLAGAIENPLLWQVGQPNLYQYRVSVTAMGETIVLQKTFGFRTVGARGTQLTVNDVPVYLRGLLHWGYYDKEITPNPSYEAVCGEISAIGEYGFNAIKHCLYIPRDNYLFAADEKGILQWIELPLWLPDATSELSARIRREYPRIIRQLAGHPSIVLTSLGCELDDKVGGDVLEEMYNLLKAKTDTLVKDNSGSGECYGGLKVEYADYFDYHFYADLQNFENLLESFTPAWRNTKPWLFGEFCDSDVMRDLREVREAYGVDRLMWESGDAHSNPISVLKPDFFAHHFDKRASESGILQRIDRIKLLSENHSFVHRKITLELTRQEPVVGGYNITSLRDVPLCGNGMFDDMGMPRFNTALFKNSNSDVVLLPAWDLTRIWLSADRIMPKERFNFAGGDYGLHVLLSYYALPALEGVSVRYELLRGDDVLASGIERCEASFETGDVKELCYISFALPEAQAPMSCLLRVFAESGETAFENEWPVFLYPVLKKSEKKLAVYDTADVFRNIEQLYNATRINDDAEIINAEAVLTTALTKNIRDYAKVGGKVVLVQRGAGGLPVRNCSFWREAMWWREEGSFFDKLGYLPLYDDLRFFAVACETALYPEEILKMGFTNYKPILRRYDCREWFCHDYIAEFNCGKGKITATTLRLEGGMGKQPLFINNNCFGQWLLAEMLK